MSRKLPSRRAVVEGVAEQPVAVDGDRREQAGLVAEVVRRGRVGDAGAPGDAAQRQAAGPASSIVAMAARNSAARRSPWW